MKRCAIFIFLLCTGSALLAQDQLYERGTLSVGADFGLAYVKGKTLSNTFALGYPAYAVLPSPSILVDYKFTKNAFGLNSALQLDLYEVNDSRLMYLSIPLQGNVRFGKTFQFLMAAGFSNNFLLASSINTGSPNYDTYRKASDKHAIGLLANIEAAYNFDNQKHKLSFNIGYTNLLGGQFTTKAPLRIGTSEATISLSQFRFALGYKYVLFTKR